MPGPCKKEKRRKDENKLKRKYYLLENMKKTTNDTPS
jgi:hypothetical protein